MNGAKAAVVAMVKTPGASPVKTRLAEGIGRERAEAFYRQSVAAVEETLAGVSGATAYWAVAEPAGLSDPIWARFPRIAQGVGGLGDRLDRVIAALLSHHDSVVVIGGDSPQIAPDDIRQAIAALRGDPEGADFVLGRTFDGGFYLFGSRRAMPTSVWTSIEYGTSTVATELAAAITRCGRFRELPRLTDVDRVDDLTALVVELRRLKHPTTAQSAILQWTIDILAESAQQ